MIGVGNSVIKGKLGGGTPAAPVNISQPFLIGTGEVGTVVTCNKGTWSGFPAISYTYDFKVNSITVQSGSSNEYEVLPDDDTLEITCEVTATNSQGSASATTSNSITVGTAPVNTDAPTVSPSGTRVTGTVITVNVGTWSGTPTIIYEYRWTRNGSPISGAVNTTYTIQATDDGTTIRCEVRGTNAYGVSSYIASSNSVSAVNAIAPVNTVAPVISGSTTLGSTLTSTTGTWTGTPTPTYSYQWKRNGSNIGGATASTYVTTLADSSANITCDVTATNVAGSATAGSNTITLPSYAPVNTVLPVVNGTAVVGQTLSTTNGTWTNSPSTFAYQWFRGATPIGTNSANYTLVQADAGNTSNITCRVTATNSAGSANATSNTIAQILDANMKAWLIDALGIQNNSTTYFTSTRQRTGAQLVSYYNDFYIGLKSNNIYSAIRAMYRPRFADANLNKFNMVNPLDTNGAYRMTYSGTWTYQETGELPNGTNAWCNTNLAANVMAQNSISIGVDLYTAGTAGNRADISVPTDSSLYIAARYDANPILGNAISNVNNTGLKTVTNTGVIAFWLATRNSSTERLFYKNATLIDTFTATSTTPVAGTIQFGRGQTASEFSDRGQRFRIIADGLTGTQITNLNTLLTTLTTSEGI